MDMYKYKYFFLIFFIILTFYTIHICIHTMASILVYKYAYICTCIEFCNYALSSNLVVDKIFLNKYTYICRTYMFNVIKPLNN